MEVTAIRHTSVNVARGVCYGRTDVEVNHDSFQAESATTRKALSEIDDNYDAVFTSPLTRCRMLAQACGYSEAIVDSRLQEMDFGDWEMQSFDSITDPRLQEWYDDWLNVCPTGGESFADQYERVSNWIDYCREQGYKRILVFAHGGIIMQMMRLSGLDVMEAVRNQPKYGEIKQLIIK